MGLPVEMRPVQDAMQPAFQKLRAENAVVPLQGSRANALRTLSALMDADSHLPASLADSILSDLKQYVFSDPSIIRDRGRAVVGQAVKQLEAQLQDIVSQSPDAQQALTEGRAATTAAHRASEVLEGRSGVHTALSTDPVGLFNQLVSPGEKGLAHLRRVQAVTPDAIPAIGRAWLDQALDFATERGRFEHADRLYSNWQKLGPETKQILFGDQVAELDNFFNLAKRIKENVNPSGSAPTAAAMGQVLQAWTSPLTALGTQLGAYGLAKLLYTPQGVRALNAMLQLDPVIATGRVSGAAREAAWATVAMAAQKAGVSVPLQLQRAAFVTPDDRSATRPAE
jgi:hypothetical protein